MKSILLNFLLLFYAGTTLGQKESFDLTSYIPPNGWAREAKEQVVTYSNNDSKKKTWCQLLIVKSTLSKGSIDLDFDNDWQELVAIPFKSNETPQLNDVQESDGWKIKSGAGKVTEDNNIALVLLTTITGYNRRISIIAFTNNKDYLKDIETFLGTIEIKKPVEHIEPQINPTNEATEKSSSGRFAFTTTNFDDGWTATEQPDWVQVSKGSVTVFLHHGIEYTNETRNLDEDKRIAYFWNMLVAPRHRINNYVITPCLISYDRIYFADGDGTEISTGKSFHVALMIYAENGFAKCIEIITPDKATLTQQFPSFDKMKTMNNYNKFAVGPNDVLGNWGSSSSVYGQYYYTATGNFAGMSGVSMSSSFNFKAGNNYHYEYAGVSGMIGNELVHTENKDGKYKVSNWEFSTTEKNGTTTDYYAQFEAVRGGRILHLKNKKYSGLQYHLVKQIGK